MFFVLTRIIDFVFCHSIFLKTSFYTFTNEDLFDLFDFDFIEEDDIRMFPESEKSIDVLNGLKKHLEKEGCGLG